MDQMAVNSYGQEMLNKYIYYKHRVNRALEEGRIFRIVGHYDWPRIRTEMAKRGWIEKRQFASDNPIVDLPHSILLEEAEPGNNYELALIARMIGRTKPTWMWMMNGKYYYRNLDIPIMNKLYVRNCNFGGKDGLQQYFEVMDYGSHPRGYNLIECKCLEVFVEDYYLTAATSLILFLDNHQSLVDRFAKGEENCVPWSAIITVFQFVTQHIDSAQYGMSVSQENCKNSGLNEQKAKVILATYLNIVKNGMRIETYHKNVQDHIPIIRTIAQKVRDTWPQRIHDGYMNTWLLKPAYSGQGNGIIMSADIEEIVNIVKEDTDTKKYIVQKYIERPLLVHNTKFDLRQYFLLTVHKNKMRGWAHSKCTVRLASEEFTFDRFSRAIHITNTAVQRRFKKRSNEHLPHLHWGIKDLVQYLWKMGKPHAWQEIIFPQIKRTLVSFMKSAAPNIEQRPGRYEIFGCDWLVTEDLQTYMLEINRSPALYYYSEVSVDVVGTVMNDLIKVTVDYMKDETASTGGFELICEIDMSTLEPFDVDWSQYYRPRKSVTPTDDIHDYLYEVTRQSSVEPCPDENIIPRPPSPPPLPLPEPDPNMTKLPKKSEVKTQKQPQQKPVALPTIVIDAPPQQPEDRKKVLQETTKGNIMTGTSSTEKKIEEKMYIIPPNKKRARNEDNKSQDSNKTNNEKSNNKNSDNRENTLSQPEMGQDFDPYGETLITY